MSSGKVKCTCGWSWNKSDSSKKDMYICHECGRDNSNNMKNGGWLDNYNDSETSVPEGYVGEGYSIKGRDYSPAWGGQFQTGGYLKKVKKTEKDLLKKYVNPAQARALTRAKQQGINTGIHNGPLDAIRHSSSAAAMSSALPTWTNFIPGVAPLKIAATNAAGIAHEIGSPNSWKEHASDVYNNFIGSVVGALPISEKNQHDLLIKAQKYGVLSDMGDKTPLRKRPAAPQLAVPKLPPFQMGGSIPGAVGFSYARTQSPAPSNGPYAKKTKASAQDGAEVDMHGSPITAIEKHRYDIDRSYYDPRTNQMILGADYAASDNKDKMIAHENYHAKQHSEGRDNFDIGHNTENRQWAEMQKRPQMMSTPEVWNNFYNRKAIESDMMINKIAERLPESQFFRNAAGDIIYNKIVDPRQYKIPYSFEGEAEYYENTGEEFQNGGWLDQYKEGGVIKDDLGQWAHPGEITEIDSNQITMEGVPYDVLGISDTGDTKLMKPGKNYKFKGKKVTEFPMAKNGLRQEQKSLQNLDNLTNFTNYNKPQPGGWLNKYN